MREIEELAQAGDSRAKLALKMFCYRIQKYIGAYHAVLGRLDALIFTAGIGENSPLIRAGICRGLSHLGMAIDPEKNKLKSKKAFEIQRRGSTVRILVIPTNEELEIAEQTVEVVSKSQLPA